MTQAELSFEVKIPQEGTQNYVLLMALERGERLTIWSAMGNYGCGALHQRMKELRDMGWPIQRRVIDKNGKRVAEFWMEL